MEKYCFIFQHTPLRFLALTKSPIGKQVTCF